MRRIHNNTPIYALPFYDITLTTREAGVSVGYPGQIGKGVLMLETADGDGK
jgi:hypothetical protein